jgi:hypothetical protein
VVLGLDELLLILLDGILEDHDRFLQLVDLDLVRFGGGGVVVDYGKLGNLGF